MNNKEFAEKNAGKYFLYGDKKVQVVGYHAKGHQILVSIPSTVQNFGWDVEILNENDILVIPTKAKKLRYVNEGDLKKWE